MSSDQTYGHAGKSTLKVEIVSSLRLPLLEAHIDTLLDIEKPIRFMVCK